MNFLDALKQSNTENVISFLKTHYECSEKDETGYRKLISDLLKKKPVSTKCMISVAHFVDGEEEYEHVSGIVPGEEFSRAIGLCPRAEWLSMELTEETMENYTIDEIVSHCLWEMTFYGFEDKDVQAMQNEIDSFSIEECSMQEEGESLDDFLFRS